MNWFRKRFARRPLSVKPRLEQLERREVMSATFHGGAVLPQVEVQGVYYGVGWHDTSMNLQGYTPYQLTSYLEGELGYLVQSPFMDTLTDAGYGVGRGSDQTGRIYTISLAQNSTLTDASIRLNLQQKISDGGLQAPDANRLYVIFVEPNIIVQEAGGALSNSTTPGQAFSGYHGAFAGTDAQHNAAVIHYVVIPTPGGTVHKASANSSLTTADAISLAFSQQLANAVTDPNNGFSTKGWYDDAAHAEIAGASSAFVRLNGFAAAEIANQQGTSLGAVQDEVVMRPGQGVYRYEDATGWMQLTPANASQAVIDDNGDVAAEIPGAGVWRFEDASGWTQLTPADASQVSIAGNGIVAAEISGFGVWRFEDAKGWQKMTPADATHIGVDAHGDVVAAIAGAGVCRYLYTAGWAHLTPDDAAQVSIAGNGIVAAAITGFGVWRFEDAGGWKPLTPADPSQMSLDSSGDVVAAIQGAGVWRFEDATNWEQLTPVDASMVEIAGNGIVVIEIPGAGVWRFEDAAGWGQLTTEDVTFLSAVA